MEGEEEGMRGEGGEVTKIFVALEKHIQLC